MFHKAKISPQSGVFCLKWFDIYYLVKKEKRGVIRERTAGKERIDRQGKWSRVKGRDWRSGREKKRSSVVSIWIPHIRKHALGACPTLML